MANVALLRFKGKLDPMLPKAELQIADAGEVEADVPGESIDAVGARQ
jgi:hypothetical protein